MPFSKHREQWVNTNPKITPERYKDAYYILSIMIGRYDHDQTYTYDHVAAAVERGHELIQGIASKGSALAASTNALH